LLALLAFTFGLGFSAIHSCAPGICFRAHNVLI
jgi:hypothetical protein